MDEMRKITKWTLGYEDKILMFKWIVERIDSNGVHTTWVKRGIRDSEQAMSDDRRWCFMLGSGGYDSQFYIRLCI